MKPIEEILKHMNSLHYPPKISEAVLKRNSYGSTLTDFSHFRFISGVKLYKHHRTFSKNSGIPFWDGDFAFYLADKDYEPLAGCSVKINPGYFYVNSIQGIKGRKTRRKKLKGSDYNIIRYSNWEMALLDVIETSAKDCLAKHVKVASSWSQKDSSRRIIMRYDIPCICRNYEMKDYLWVKRV